MLLTARSLVAVISYINIQRFHVLMRFSGLISCMYKHVFEVWCTFKALQKMPS